MKVKKKLKVRKLPLIIIALLLIMVIVCIEAMNVMAAPLTWETIWYRGDCDLRTVPAWSLRDDCVECGAKQTLNAKADGPIYSGTNHYFDNVVVGDSSRAMYAKRLTVSNGMTISIVAAQEDTADAGGITYIKGNNTGDNLYFYWSIGEYDANGNVVFDGDWRGVNESWTVGKELNHDSYGTSGYPLGVSQADRENRVNCIMPVFRWAKGGLNVGGGSEYPFSMSNLKDRFQIIQIVTKPFTYTFNYNDGSGNYTTIERLGINNVSVPATPQRAGYVFTGWKITSTGGKQAGKVYDAGQLAEMFSDSKYYSSLFTDTTFEAQWANADQFVNYMGNGSDNMSDYYKSYAASYSQNKYDAINFTKTGYTAEENWEARDKMDNYWFSTAGDGTSKMLQLSGTTTIRSKLNIDSTIDVSEGSLQNGANVQTWGCAYNSAQTFSFQFIKLENGVPYWAIRNTYSGKVLDLALNTGANGGNDGANVQMYTYHGGDNQLWTLEMAGDGYFYIRSKLDNNLVLDLWGNEAGNGKNIAVSGFHGGDNQKWCLCDNSINLYAKWTNNNYQVSYDADGGTLYDDSGNETTQNVKTYEYDKTYSFYTAKRAYTVSYETNGGTASIGTSNTNAAATFNGWNENLDSNTDHGIINGSGAYTTGTWNWAAYLNGNPDLLNAAGNIYNTTWAIWHYRGWGSKPEENRKFNGNSYWLPSLKFRNLTANGGTVYVKANYTNGSVILPDAEKEWTEENGVRTEYVLEGWYTDKALTKRAGSAGDTYIPGSDMTLYAKYTAENLTPLTCYYSVDPNGGTYTFEENTYSETAVFGLQYNNSVVIPNPEKEGDYFDGWEIVLGEDEKGTDSRYESSTHILTMGHKQIGDTGLNVTFKAKWSHIPDWSVVLSCNRYDCTDPDWTFIGTTTFPLLQPQVPEHKPTLSYLGDYYGDYNTMEGYLKTVINGRASRIVYDFTDDYNEAGLDDIEVELDESAEHSVDGGGGANGRRSFTVPESLLPGDEDDYSRKPGYVKVTVYYDGDEEMGLPGYESTKYVEFDLKRFEWKIKSCIIYQSGQAHKPIPKN